MTKKITKFLKESTDEEVLEAFSQFLERVGLSTQFIETEDGLLTHQVLTVACGGSILVSDPEELEWPLQRLPMPDAFKKELN